MDTLTYVCRECEASALRIEVPLISVKATAFNDDVPALISSHRRLLCMNMKQSNRLRVLTHRGSYAEVEVGATVLRNLVSSEGLLEHCYFFAAGGNVVARLAPIRQANGDVKIEKREVRLPEEVYGVTVGYGDIVYVLGRSCAFEVHMESSKTSPIGLAPRTFVKHSVIGYHQQAKLLLAPAKANCLDLVSATAGASVLPKVWEPHANSMPTAAFFFQRRSFSNENSDNLFIVTASHGNRELRLWSYSQRTKTFTLKQDISITMEDDGVVDGDENAFLISCTPTEEYITLCSKQRPLAVVLELNRSSFKVDRVTSWRLNGPVLGSAAAVSKMTESASSTSVEYQVILTVRTATGFYGEVLDVEKPAEASNTPSLRTNSASSWFPKNEAAHIGGTEIALPTALTSVSSSVLGDKTTNAVPQGVASNIVRQQASQFCETLRSIDERVVNLQKHASEAMRLLQEAWEREKAQTIGREFAIRNKGRLEQQQQVAGQSTDNLTPRQQELLEEIRSIVEKSEQLAVDTATEVVKAQLSRRLKDAVAKGAKEADQVELSSGTPIVRSTDSMRLFSNGVDAAVRTLVRAVKGYHKTMKTVVDSSSAATASCVAKAREFTASLNREKQLLASELMATMEVVRHGGAPTQPVDPDALVARAIALAEANDWVTSFTTVLEASDITVLLHFLESEVCVNNVTAMVNPQSITLPTFLSLCLQLSFELNNLQGLIPSRVKALHAFFVEWDDTLKDMKSRAADGNSKHKPMFELTKRELRNVLEQLEIVDDKAVDRCSRNNLRLLKKLIHFLVT
ncbi:hypothetical protein, conserved [Trypanosoma brucei gambiense DAL972]|uniref:Uncharacterized protein n=1 Tax=Trypanosoma brucei gambiense (strain MHOM/CI/86/DAL972) TaxID=679716 RepID=D0A6H6_TRYB9|nr:hypothetical protein, conserved [Trypanosoma brucei gambiense DAL972]CBH17277.1 hypothetical protein, conserved [Trypanosoma brucei gambiense DAL972]|eukprot:XP_011779541.1 hypothetical protein, conserved [Trypanosoma brucei gambiense DAL972]